MVSDLLSDLNEILRDRPSSSIHGSDGSSSSATGKGGIMRDVGLSSGAAFDFVAVPTPWIRPGVVVHDAAHVIDKLLEEFALALRSRGFAVRGYVQRNGRDCTRKGDGCSGLVDYVEISSSNILSLERSAVAALLRGARSHDADLVVLGRLSACLPFEEGAPSPFDVSSGGPPILTSVAGRCVEKWHDRTGGQGEMIAPEAKSLWEWWGPERLYRDLIYGVDEREARRIVCGPRWIMVEGPYGVGLAYLPKHPREFSSRLASLSRGSLRTLAELARSTDPLETALGVASINAHYNRRDLAANPGNGVRKLRKVPGDAVVIGAFPGVDGILPRCKLIEADPRPNEYPMAALESFLPGHGAAIVNSSALINRSLPRILRLARSRCVALIGPSTPLTPRLFDYGLHSLGGLIVDDADGLARAIESGALPREFSRFGRYVHLERVDSKSG